MANKKQKAENLKEISIKNVSAKDEHIPVAVPVEKEELSIEDANERVAGYCQWAVGQDGCYIPTFTSTKSVPPGVYEIQQNNQGYFLQKQKIVLSDNILELPLDVMQE